MSIEEKLVQVQAEAEQFQEALRRERESLADTTSKKHRNPLNLLLVTEHSRNIPPLGRNMVRVRRTLKGHISKVYSLQWSHDSRHIVSVAGDGKMIVWDGYTSNKVHAISLRSTWVMTCAMSQSGKMVASGGLDNLCTVYSLREVEDAMSNLRDGLPTVRPSRELVGHIGFVSCARFLGDREILTSSGDCTCALWDIDRGLPKTTFRGHTGDVLYLAPLAPADQSGTPAVQTFVSGGCDTTLRVWDIRTGRAERIYVGHTEAINTLDAFPDGMAFLSGGDDKSIRLFDLRADRELQRYVRGADEASGAASDAGGNVVSAAFTHSGRAIYAAYDDGTSINVWDTLRSERVALLEGHENRVSSVGVTKDGYGLCSASWDGNLKIWA